MKSRRKVLITGGTGFLGVYLARYFLKKKFLVLLLDTEPLTDRKLLKNKSVEVVECDIRDKKKLAECFYDVDYVVHAAAALPIHNDREYIFDVNVAGTKNVLEESLKNNVSRVVFISTTAMYGVPQHLPEKETDPISPIGYYGESKAEGEKLCKRYHKKGLPVVIIRPKTFLGPERLGIFTLWFEAIYAHKPVFILGDGNNLYQLLEVNDLCELIYSALSAKSVSGEIFNAGASEFASWREDLEALIAHAKSKSKIVGLPVVPSQILLAILEKLHLSPIVAWHYKTFPVDSYVSTEKAQKKLGFRSTKSNKKILIESYDWYKEHRKEVLSHSGGTTHRKIWNFKIVDIISRFL